MHSKDRNTEIDEQVEHCESESPTPICDFVTESRDSVKRHGAPEEIRNVAQQLLEKLDAPEVGACEGDDAKLEKPHKHPGKTS